MAYELSENDIAALEAENDQTLAEWWCHLNRSPRYSCYGENLWAVMGWIEAKITIRECLWAWNDIKQKEGRSEV